MAVRMIERLVEKMVEKNARQSALRIPNPGISDLSKIMYSVPTCSTGNLGKGVANAQFGEEEKTDFMLKYLRGFLFTFFQYFF
jgi:hypothetical protein